MSATISLVMPVYNRSPYLGAAIESIINQTRQDFELLIWDDGSTDNSLDIARSYAKSDPRITVVAAPHQGISRSLKAAIAATSGIYMGWVDSDDLLAPTALSETASILETHPNVGLVYTDYLVIDEQEQVQGYGHRCHIPYSKERLLVDFMVFHFRLIRREVYNLVGGMDESFSLASDYDLCLRISEVTSIYPLKKPLYYYRQHQESVSNTHQVEQILAAKEAINNALIRRGMSERYSLNVQILGKYQLLLKN